MPALRQVRYVTADGAPDPAFEAHFQGLCDIACAADRNGAVAESDVVITATRGRGALFELSAVRPGTHFNCVGADTKGGEAQWASDEPCIELDDILSGKLDACREPNDITVFDMTGLALQDLTVARLFTIGSRRAGWDHDPWPW